MCVRNVTLLTIHMYASIQIFVGVCVCVRNITLLTIHMYNCGCVFIRMYICVYVTLFVVKIEAFKEVSYRQKQATVQSLWRHEFLV